ncbi:MAG: diacylglycerol kinase, partial [Oscillospiraceae bacterium]|nr:diacylglycerol kinase [Oscillospiraceae bacterium]
MKAFARAWDGIRHAVKTERNLRVQLCFAAYVILFGV